jgi:hypothetical protein
MVSELITFKGETDGTSTSGDFPLYSDILYITGSAPFTAPTYIVIPPGMKAKIWTKRISGDVETNVIIQFTKNITASPVVWIPLDVEKLASKGEINLEKRRPIVVRGILGTEAIKISWSQPTAGKAYVVVEIELTDEE